ncbi:MAG: DNA polymerase III subunit, partial [Planctomycetota bacterium]
MSSFDVQHQDRAERIIQRALSAERLPHAYLFHGPEGVGKETFARALATLLLCPQPLRSESADGQPQLAPCGKCHDCRTAQAGTHPDLHLIYRQLIKYHDDTAVRRRKGLDLGVDVIRQFVIDKVGTKPIRGRAKVFVIREADRITPQAQNALLKTLEEPPDTTFLILLVSSLDRMLPTTRSRCHLTPFGALPADFIAAELTRRVAELAPERARLIARFSQGSMALALQHAEDGLDQQNDQLVRMLLELPQRPVAEVVEGLSDQAKTLCQGYRRRDPEITETEALRRGLKAIFALAATWYRDVLHTAVASTDLVANVAHAAQLSAAAKGLSPVRAIAAINRLAETEGQLDANVNVKLCLDTLAIRLAHLAR